MKKLLKNKRIIAFVLCFTMSFMVVADFKEKETQAVVGVDDLILWTLGSLILASGVVAISGGQITDMGTMVYERMANLGQDIEYIKKGSIITGIKIGESLKSAIDWVSENLTTTDKYIDKSYPFIGTTSFYPNYATPSNLEVITFEKFYNSVVSDFYLVVNNPTSSDVRVTFKTDKSTRVDSVSCSPGITNIKFYSKLEPGEYKYFLSTTYENNGYYYIGGQQSEKTPFNLTISVPDSLTIISSDIMEKIPYSNPLIKQGYNPTYTNDNLTIPNEKEGYIPIPSAIPTDVPISTEIPYTWDNVKDNINVIPVDGVKDDVLDIPNEGSVDIPTEQTGLWGWLSSLLRAIFNVLKAVLNAILGLVQGILNGILDILTGLLSALIDAISSLFVPTVSVAELFAPPSGSGFSALLDLFNWDSVFNIEPKPYKFKTDMLMKDLSNNDNDKNWNIEVNLFDNSVVKNNINLVRNVLSYSLLISVVYFIVYHFLPKRDMD